RLIGGLAYTQRLRHYKAVPLGEKWQQRLHSLSQTIGIPQAVRLVESRVVRVPMTIGFAKPVILLPIGAVAGLPQAQVEAILAHELAHILRRDYLVNLLQSVVEILFFYHPAVWWMSGVLRAEREHCCDDIAVSICGDSLTYARALTELEAMRLPQAPAMAMALSGNRGSLVSRIKRLVGQPPLRPTFSEGFAAALVLVMGISVLSCSTAAGINDSSTTQAQTSPAAGAATERSASSEPEASEEETSAAAYTLQDTGGEKQDVVIIKNKKGKVTELYVDGKRIPQKDIPAYTELVDQRLQATARAPKASRAEVEREIQRARAAAAEASRNRTYSFQYQYGDGDSLAMAPLPPIPPMPPVPPVMDGAAIAPPPPVPPLPPVPPFPGDEEQRQFKEAQKRYEKELKEHEQEMRQHEREMREHQRAAAAESRRGRSPLDEQRYREMAERQRALAERQATRSREMAERSRELSQRRMEMAKRHKEMAQQRKDQMQQVRKELVKDGIIDKDTSNLSIQMNNEGFYVNGKKQSQEMYEKYKKLMNLKLEGSSNYNFQFNDN
ncbi:MAG: M48 family metalloprotease, partial [Hymenobacteraceae bacterium]|nr:M48 family metalloprotease [Hymenobacteraceae bacterium]